MTKGYCRSSVLGRRRQGVCVSDVANSRAHEHGLKTFEPSKYYIVTFALFSNGEVVLDKISRN